ncbi:MAG: F0F1 ATP synthase subunit A, partial [Myxococcales bacterium]|nr:F0F1 ATP synthase subunit A [Myxococcales bacterium]
MPHGESWLSFLAFYDGALHAAQQKLGVTFIGHTPVGIQHVLGFALVLILVTLLGLYVAPRLADTKAALVPEDRLTVRTFVELFVSAVYGMMTPLLGKKAAKFFLPLIGTTAFMIFFSNVLGLIPGFLPPTDNLNTTFAAAIVIFASTHVFGIKEHGAGYVKQFLGPVWWMIPIMLPIELISHAA